MKYVVVTLCVAACLTGATLLGIGLNNERNNRWPYPHFFVSYNTQKFMAFMMVIYPFIVTILASIVMKG